MQAQPFSKSFGFPVEADAGNDNVKLCGAVHDEILLLVREGLEDEWAHILKTCMEAAEATWLGDVPAIADVKVGSCWAETH